MTLFYNLLNKICVKTFVGWFPRSRIAESMGKCILSSYTYFRTSFQRGSYVCSYDATQGLAHLVLLIPMSARLVGVTCNLLTLSFAHLLSKLFILREGQWEIRWREILHFNFSLFLPGFILHPCLPLSFFWKCEKRVSLEATGKELRKN